MSDGIAKLIDLFVESFKFFIPWVILDHQEMGVVLRYGIAGRVLGPGFHWVIPFNVEHVFYDNVKTRAKAIGIQSLWTKDGRPVSLNAVITSNIFDIKLSLLEVESVDQAMLDSCAGVIGRLVTTSTWEQVLDEDFPNKAAIACRRRAKRYGIEIEEIQLMELTPARTLRLLQDQKADAGE